MPRVRDDVDLISQIICEQEQIRLMLEGQRQALQTAYDADQITPGAFVALNKGQGNLFRRLDMAAELTDDAGKWRTLGNPRSSAASQKPRELVTS